ncbi:NAD(P)/FAD-dependent oxidoreductase [Candidatus Margulisiibacteriota bacterium]
MDIELLEKILTAKKHTEAAEDLLIIGGGPAGIIASQYAQRDGLKTRLIEPRELARKVAHHDINFLPAAPGVVKGPELAKILKEKVECPHLQDKVIKVNSISPKEQVVYTTTGQIYYAKAVLIATGLRKRNAGIPNEEDFRSRGVYIVLDAAPNTECVKGLVALDRDGFIKTGDNLMTNVPGIFAAGDVRVKYLRQVVTAAADGATSALSIVNYLRE